MAYILKPRSLDRSVEVTPLQDLIPSHTYDFTLVERLGKAMPMFTLKFHALSGAPSKYRNRCVVPLLHERTE